MSVIYSETTKSFLLSGLAELGVDCDDSQVVKIQQYLTLLIRWNKTYNLTAIKDPFDMIRLHIFDSLSISKFLKDRRFIDVGTGPGLPGIPLAIVNPDKSFDLLDSNGKKTRFLFQVKTELDLRNVVEINSRVEKFSPTEKYDGVLSRAFSSLNDMLVNCRHLLADSGHFYAMKGRLTPSELKRLPENCTVVNTYPLRVPGVDAERHLVIIVCNGEGKITVG
jgi:16S rRNA (guanine527-N7)-methyltransferase